MLRTQIHDFWLPLTEKDQAGIGRKVKLGKADTTDGAIILEMVNDNVACTQLMWGVFILPMNARTIVRSRCPEHPWAGSGGVFRASKVAQTA
jgi:hypothetical protein